MFKVLDEVCTPTRGTKHSAAIDLFASKDVVIPAGQSVKVPLGVCIDAEKLEEIAKSHLNIYFNYSMQEIEDIKNEFLDSHYLQLEPRSSLRAKGLQAGTGIIDLDYKDEIMIILHNPITEVFSSELGGECVLGQKYRINKGDKIAQIMLCEHKTYLMGVESEEERKGGFGSTGE